MEATHSTTIAANLTLGRPLPEDCGVADLRELVAGDPMEDDGGPMKVRAWPTLGVPPRTKWPL